MMEGKYRFSLARFISFYCTRHYIAPSIHPSSYRYRPYLHQHHSQFLLWLSLFSFDFPYLTRLPAPFLPNDDDLIIDRTLLQQPTIDTR